MHEFESKITTPHGQMDTFICHPEEEAPHPAVVIYMDAPAIREELRDMARRIATVGYYVVLPNLYYRHGTEHTYGFDHAKTRQPDGQAHLKRMFELMTSLSNEKIISDTGPLIEFIRSDNAAKPGPMGCVGYCMSGQYVVSVAAAYSDDYAAAASFYGVGILTDAEDSPHLRASEIKGELYLAFAEEDEFVPPEIVRALPAELAKSGVKHRIEIYPDTGHGFAFPNRPAYHKVSGERHWERIFALFNRNL